jgi:hypothetical protein
VEAATVTKTLLVLVLAAGLTAGSRGAAHAGTPDCFGAAARDPELPCVNRKLDYMARPTPAHAALESVAPCTTIRDTKPGVCAFGRSRRRAASTFAVVGDSHAVHWRPALSVLARANRSRGVSITRSNCPFTFARIPPREGYCKGWARSVVRWFTAHPNVHTLFVSAHSGARIDAPPATYDETKMNGYTRAWAALPASVHEVFVIRDVPHSTSGTRRCVQRAITHHRKPGPDCARPRHAALGADLAVAAAQKAAAARVKVIDLTPFMCDERDCFPAVGGVLVNKDLDHLTRDFSATLGTFLERAVMRLRAAG